MGFSKLANPKNQFRPFKKYRFLGPLQESSPLEILIQKIWDGTQESVLLISWEVLLVIAKLGQPSHIMHSMGLSTLHCTTRPSSPVPS